MLSYHFAVSYVAHTVLQMLLFGWEEFGLSRDYYVCDTSENCFVSIKLNHIVLWCYLCKKRTSGAAGFPRCEHMLLYEINVHMSETSSY